MINVGYINETRKFKDIFQKPDQFPEAPICHNKRNLKFGTCTPKYPLRLCTSESTMKS